MVTGVARNPRTGAQENAEPAEKPPVTQTSLPAESAPSTIASALPDDDAVRVLLVEDDEDDYLITREMLAARTGSLLVEWCASTTRR